MTSRCGRASPGSIPGGAKFFYPWHTIPYGVVNAQYSWYSMLHHATPAPIYYMMIHHNGGGLVSFSLIIVTNSCWAHVSSTMNGRIKLYSPATFIYIYGFEVAHAPSQSNPGSQTCGFNVSTETSEGSRSVMPAKSNKYMLWTASTKLITTRPDQTRRPRLYYSTSTCVG